MKKNSQKPLRTIFKITLKFITRPVLPHITICMQMQLILTTVTVKEYGLLHYLFSWCHTIQVFEMAKGPTVQFPVPYLFWSAVSISQHNRSSVKFQYLNWWLHQFISSNFCIDQSINLDQIFASGKRLGFNYFVASKKNYFVLSWLFPFIWFCSSKLGIGRYCISIDWYGIYIFEYRCLPLTR